MGSVLEVLARDGGGDEAADGLREIAAQLEAALDDLSGRGDDLRTAYDRCRGVQ